MVRWLVPHLLTLVVMPLLPILVQQQQWQHPRRVCRRQQCLRIMMRTAQNGLWRWLQRGRQVSASRQGGHLLRTSVSWGACGLCNAYVIIPIALPSFAELLNFQIAGVWFYRWYHIIHDIMVQNLWYWNFQIAGVWFYTWYHIIHDIMVQNLWYCLWFHESMIS